MREIDEEMQHVTENFFVISLISLLLLLNNFFQTTVIQSF